MIKVVQYSSAELRLTDRFSVHPYASTPVAHPPMDFELRFLIFDEKTIYYLVNFTKPHPTVVMKVSLWLQGRT